MFAIRDDREYVNQEDLTKAARKVGEAKKHESKCFQYLFYQCLTGFRQPKWSIRCSIVSLPIACVLVTQYNIDVKDSKSLVYECHYSNCLF
jgi:hypothetical protein